LKARATIAALVAGAAVLAPAAVAGSTATGDANAISFYGSVLQAETGPSALQYVETGLVWMQSFTGKRSSSFQWRWGVKRPSGYVAAREQVTVGLHAGIVSWVRDDLRASSRRPGAAGQPFEVVVSKRGIFGRWLLPGKQFRCYVAVRPNDHPFPSPGQALFSAVGVFSPLVTHGDTVLVTSRWPYGLGRTATETDSVSASNQLIQASRLRISGSRTQPPITVNESFSYLDQAPPAPRIRLCR
jgi:hypothetical protein